MSEMDLLKELRAFEKEASSLRTEMKNYEDAIAAILVEIERMREGERLAEEELSQLRIQEEKEEKEISRLQKMVDRIRRAMETGKAHDYDTAKSQEEGLLNRISEIEDRLLDNLDNQEEQQRQSAHWRESLLHHQKIQGCNNVWSNMCLKSMRIMKIK